MEIDFALESWKLIIRAIQKGQWLSGEGNNALAPREKTELDSLIEKIKDEVWEQEREML